MDVSEICCQKYIQQNYAKANSYLDVKILDGATFGRLTATWCYTKCQPLLDFKAAKKAAKIAAKSSSTVMRQARAVTVKLDILDMDPSEIIPYVCTAANVNESQVMFLYAGIPCETFSIAG